MRTSKLWLSAVALSVMIFWVEPASAVERDLAVHTALALDMNSSASVTHGQIAMAGMFAILAAMLTLRRRSRNDD